MCYNLPVAFAFSYPCLGHAAPDLLGLGPTGALNPAGKDQPWQLGVMPHGAWVDLVP